MGTFWFGGKSSAQYGIIMQAPPPIILAERDIESVPVLGRSGDVLFDRGRYKNITIPYKCALLPAPGVSLRSTAMAAADMLTSQARYMRLENDYYPAQYRMARVSENISVESIVEQAGEFEVHFDCHPQRYFVDGDQVQRFDCPGSLFNPTDCPAVPQITVYGAGPGVLQVGAYRCEILRLEDWLVIDCDLMYVHHGRGTNCNSWVHIPSFPQLVSGEIPIYWSGGITKVEIKPRWWSI